MVKTTVAERVAKHRLIKEAARFKNEWLNGRDEVTASDFVAAKTLEFEAKHRVELMRFDPEWMERFLLELGINGYDGRLDVVTLLSAWKLAENPAQDRADEAATP